MAAPTITDVLLAPTGPFAPGDVFTVTIVATDADERTVNLTAQVTDASGNTTEQVIAVDVVDSPFTFALLGDDTVDVVQDATDPAVFTVTVLSV